MTEFSQAQTELDTAYLERWVALTTAIPAGEAEQLKLSRPHLVDLTAFGGRYWSSPVRLMVIGQQTAGWGEAVSWAGKPAECVEQLKGYYHSFELGKHYLSTPFWGAAHELGRLINPSSPANSFIWTNLLKLDQGGDRPEDKVEKTVSAAFSVLPEEVRLARPQAVVFLTGPNFDERLTATFPECDLEKIGNHPLRELALVRGTGLPRKTFRTYHPKFLRLSKRWSLLDEIASLVLANQ